MTENKMAEMDVRKVAKPSALKETVKMVYGWLKKVGLQVFGGLFMEQKDDTGIWIVSMGKAAFWVTFGHCLYVWNTTQEITADGVTKVIRGDVSDGELYALLTLVGYAGAKLLKSTVTEGIAAFKGNGK